MGTQEKLSRGGYRFQLPVCRHILLRCDSFLATHCIKSHAVRLRQKRRQQ